MASNLAEAWQRQVAYCDAYGSPFTARVLEAAWADWQGGGTLRELLPDWPGDAWADAVPLRVAGALHSLALDGSSSALAALYPPRAEFFDIQGGTAAVSEALRTHRDRVAVFLQSAPQTNEVGRSAVLLGGFAAVAQATGLPLATFEIGASAGLNLLWHRYRYRLGDAAWGDPASPVLIRCDWRGTAPVLPAQLAVVSSAACDIAPIDLDTLAEVTRLAAYVWAGQTERQQRLGAAAALARRVGVRVERADAAEWVAQQLAATRPGCASVLYHSIVWHYLPAATRDALRDTIAAAGARATQSAPLAWLALEPPDAASFPQLTLTLWPGATQRVLADVHAHGLFADWR